MSFRSYLALVAFVIAVAAAADHTAAQERLQDSRLSEELIAHLQAHPDTTLEEAGSLANKLLERYGVNYEFDMRETENLGAFDIILSAGDRRFVTEIASDLNAGPCGERWAGIPARQVDDSHITIVQNGETFVADRPRHMALDTVKIFAANRTALLHEIHIPWQTYPGAITPAHDGIIMYMPLFDEVLPWWNQARADYSYIDWKHPFLGLTVSVSGVRFVEDAALYAPQLYDLVTRPGDEKEGVFFHRLRFRDSGLVIEFQSPCT